MSNVLHAEIAYEAAQQSPNVMPRGQRLSLVVGGLAVGAIAGFVALMATGPGSPVFSGLEAGAFALASVLAMLGLKECITQRAYGCASVMTLHMAALAGWLAMTFNASLQPFVMAAPALVTLVLFSSCWTRGAGGAYRASLQSVFLAAIASAQFMAFAFGA